jgi:hypothetical protein
MLHEIHMGLCMAMQFWQQAHLWSSLCQLCKPGLGGRKKKEFLMIRDQALELQKQFYAIAFQL